MRAGACFLIPAFLLAYSGMATADQKCVNIPDDNERLECFDAAYAPDPVIDTSADWVTQSETNNLDDSKTVIASVVAAEGVGKYGHPIILIARCKSNTTDVYVSWNHYLGNDLSYSSGRKAKRVTYRIDSNPAQKGTWGVSTDSKSTFVDRPISFLKSLIDQKKLVVQLTPYNESPVQAVFNVSGTKDAIKELSETCHWSV